MTKATKLAVGTLWVFAALAFLGAAGEIWRYILLLISRDEALNVHVVAASDVFVLTASLMAFGFAVVPVGLTLWWLFLARNTVAEQATHEAEEEGSGIAPPRSFGQVIFGIVCPVVNLFSAGSILTELEHVLLRKAFTPLRPSRVVVVWWVIWVINWLMLSLVIIWRTRDGIQAQADGVLLSGLLDLCAAALAVATLVLVRRITALLLPTPSNHFRSWRVSEVKDAPQAELRPHRPAGAVR